MSTQILIKRSTTTGAIPTAQDIAVGELAINTVDKRIFTNNSGTIVELGTTPTTQAVTGNASVGGTFDVVGAVTVGNFSADGTVDLTSATVTIPAPTADTHPATKKYVDDEVNAILDGAPAALDTLNEIAAAINDDANAFTTLTNSIATKLPLAGGTMTGAIDMGVNGITTSVDPATANTLTRKSYVDGLYQSTVDAEVSAAAAAVSETNAANSATSASTSASTATTQASNAATSATNAATSETNAGNSATSSANSATASATSATQSASSASAAATSETNAATSATNAATSETNAASSATAAASSATAASSSETNAAASETAAASSETNAAASESAAATSASNASTSETNAAASATSAASDASSTASLYDQFDDRYLGSKASAPSVDNDGNALLVGALYFNSSDSSMYSWNGSSWIQVANQSEALQAIATTKADTAVDVFVYDTRKDSDGGAWRKRTQHTSWYNETLNTATRGSRREFPAVAVIVAETTQVTIYDGDDPSLPMWMVFNTNRLSWGDSYMLWNSESLEAKNGILATGGTVGYGNIFQTIDFVKDYSEQLALAGTYYGRKTIANRNSSGNWPSSGTADDTTRKIIANVVNDVAMTVLPNAPIDSATGLPVPTIAVATDGGVSVIKDDGTVVDITGYNYGPQHIRFDKLNRIWASANYYCWVAKVDIPTQDTVINSARGEFYVGVADATNYPAVNGGLSNWSDSLFGIAPMEGGETAISINPAGARSGSGGVSILTGTEGSKDETAVAYITSSYNTGWMNGDIKLATLSDTDATDVTDTELVTNGTFDTDTSGWSANNAVLSVENNKLKILDAGSFTAAHQSITTQVGKKYVLTVDLEPISYTSDFFYVLVQNGNFVENFSFYLARYDQDSLTANTVSLSFTAQSTTSTVVLATGVTNSAYFDNISVRLAEADRSVNDKGLQVFGTVTKSPVATGADLVAYSGFSNSNYLAQPYNSDLDFGTGDFFYNIWAYKPSDSSENSIISRGQTGATNGFFYLGTNVSGQIYGYVGPSQISTSVTASSGVWNMYTVARCSGAVSFYLNGNEIYNTSNSNTLSNTNAKLYVGNSSYNVSIPYNGSSALLRISGTAPTASQIQKMYEDEKVLFQEGAQATLYGSSDAVTALAYDEDTELLHVGTSAGRSDFSGLRRVNNTTDAVGTAISASNGMIVEE